MNAPVKASAALVGSVLSVLSGAPVQAQTAIDCGNPVSQVEMTYCAEQDWMQADAALNKVYGIAMAKMRETDSYLPDNLKGAADALRDAQRAWIPYRDKACAAYGYLARGGTLEPQLIYTCRADLTRARVGELQDLNKGLGN
ncbi:lysozyme inhibitor LprI family protein [uncultured Roseibium sp.]|uniref:lysozyme inhibitor LprI family protein n=1 Tax=uncultured Roseibium sp. TaxID=1936171 RepID=UPI00263186FE|nr:lysozyme inhibitor LprI family protein [uncultured Roseibium sp.]